MVWSDEMGKRPYGENGADVGTKKSKTILECITEWDWLVSESLLFTLCFSPIS